MSTEQSPLGAIAEWSGGNDQAKWSRSFIMALAASTWAIVALVATAEISSMTQQEAVKIGLLYVSFPLIGMYLTLRALSILSRAFSNTLVDSAIQRWLSWAKQDPLLCGSLTGAVIGGTPFMGAMFWVILTGEIPNWFLDLMELVP